MASYFDFITDPLMGVYFVCTLFGGTMLVLQFLLMLFGLGGDVDAGDSGGDFDSGDADVGDTDSDVDSHSTIGHGDSFDIFKMISLRTIVAGVTFFGLGGLVGLTGGLGKPLSVVLALAGGLSAVYIVYYIYLSIARMRSDGSISSKTLVGCIGNVYLTIPAGGSAAGKVLVTQQDRTMEYEAITAGAELKSGTPIIVVRVISPTTVEVRANLD